MSHPAFDDQATPALWRALEIRNRSERARAMGALGRRAATDELLRARVLEALAHPEVR